jgi:hypothetical protein
VVNTDLNCSFKMFAFCLVSATSCPSFFKGAPPLLSVLSDFMKEKSFFGFERQNTKRSSKFYSSNLNHHFSKITSDWLHIN